MKTTSFWMSCHVLLTSYSNLATRWWKSCALSFGSFLACGFTLNKFLWMAIYVWWQFWHRFFYVFVHGCVELLSATPVSCLLAPVSCGLVCVAVFNFCSMPCSCCGNFFQAVFFVLMVIHIIHYCNLCIEAIHSCIFYIFVEWFWLIGFCVWVICVIYYIAVFVCKYYAYGFLHTAANCCIFDMTLVDIGSKVQLFLTIQLPEFRFRK